MKKHIVYSILLAIPLLYNTVQLLFIGYQRENLHVVSGKLAGHPYYVKIRKRTDEWRFRLREQKATYCIDVNSLSEKDETTLSTMQFNHSVKLYTYDDFALGQFFDNLNNRIRVVEIAFGGKNHPNEKALSKSIDEKNLFLVILCLVICAVFYFQWYLYKPLIKLLVDKDK